MYFVTAKCDKCGKTEEQTCSGAYGYGPSFNRDKNGWNSIKLTISQYNERHFLLCSECQKELGIVRTENGSKKETDVETLADRLLNVISEIVAEQISN